MTIRREDVVGPDGALLPEPLLRVLNDTFDRLQRERKAPRTQWFDVTINSSTSFPQDILLDFPDKPAAVVLAWGQENVGTPSAFVAGTPDWLWIQKQGGSYARVRALPGLTASTVYNLTLLILWRT